MVVGRKCLRNWHHQQRRLEEEEQTETSDSNRQSTQMALDRTDSKDTKHEHHKASLIELNHNDNESLEG